MKYLWLWIVGGIAAFVIYKRVVAKKVNAAAKQVVQTTGTQAPAAPWLPGWNGFTIASLGSVTKTVSGAFDALKKLSNNFGSNDGGKNPDVSIGGSSSGGTQSSGGGAGLPVGTSPSENSFPYSVSDITGAANDFSNAIGWP